MARIAALLLACGGSVGEPAINANHGPFPFTNVPAPANGTAQFSVLPVAIASGLSLAARHPFGADTRTVYMPATGAVTNIIQSTTVDTKVMFRATNSFYFYPSLDLGAFDETVTHSGFVTPARYGEQPCAPCPHTRKGPDPRHGPGPSSFTNQSHHGMD